MSDAAPLGEPRGEGSSDAPPPAPWELELPTAEAQEIEPADPVRFAVYCRERLIMVCFAAGLFLWAGAADLATYNYTLRGALTLLGFAAVGLGVRIWSTPVLVVEAGECTTSNFLPPKRRYPVNGFADLYLDGPSLIRRSDGRLLYTLRPWMVRDKDVRRLDEALQIAYGALQNRPAY